MLHGAALPKPSIDAENCPPLEAMPCPSTALETPTPIAGLNDVAVMDLVPLLGLGSRGDAGYSRRSPEEAWAGFEKGS
ncbi:hypothetical protein [Salipiger bermudensis]|uniref:hypothetical protein n=1 Tax=Salipiger bermudensis TaxID=344736 RepID=UPI00300BE36E